MPCTAMTFGSSSGNSPRSSSRRWAKPDPVQMTEPDAASDETAFVALRSRNPTDYQHPSSADDSHGLSTFARIVATIKIVVISVKMIARALLHSDMERLPGSARKMKTTASSCNAHSQLPVVGVAVLLISQTQSMSTQRWLWHPCIFQAKVALTASCVCILMVHRLMNQILLWCIVTTFLAAMETATSPTSTTATCGRDPCSRVWGVGGSQPMSRPQPLFGLQWGDW